MRRWLLVLMVLLLPLRGWVGEAMAGEMLGQRVAAHAHEAGAASQGHDCDHHHDEAAADAEQPPVQDQASDDCPTCAACQACSSVAMWPPVTRLAVTGFHHPAPQHVQGTFTSAEPVLAFKPPRG